VSAATETAERAARYLVLGYARSGQAVVEALAKEGSSVVVVDDSPAAIASEVTRAARVEFVSAPDDRRLKELVESADFVVPSPGVPPSHPVYALARDEQLLSEIDIAQARAAMPIIAVNGTNGKKTVVSLVAAMLRRSGVRAVAAGNIGFPLVTAVSDDQIDVVVAEVSSFQLALARAFRPHVAAWLNFSDNHLDWHGTRERYRRAKARIWMNQQSGDVSVVNIDDPVVESESKRSPGRVVTFGVWRGDYHLEGDAFLSPAGPVATTSDLGRDLPHDRLNALAAIATAIESGASAEGARLALASTELPPHRIALVASLAGVSYYDDSKATTPAAVGAALAGFDSVVLILGGRNKGLDLSVLRQAADDERSAEVRGVVVIGEAADEIEKAFSSGYEVTRAHSMEGAVEAARAMSRPGDAVLLSPGCTSFDWYRSFEERGEDFRRVVLGLDEQGGERQ
jgi:UDP-N-acetylmuramoylalanine--D-glutamate ligase